MDFKAVTLSGCAGIDFTLTLTTGTKMPEDYLKEWQALCFARPSGIGNISFGIPEEPDNVEDFEEELRLRSIEEQRKLFEEDNG